MENFQLFIRISGFWNTDVQLSPHVQPEFTHRKAAAVAYRAHRDPQFCWVTYFQNAPKSHSVLFACPETCSEHSQDVTVLDKENSPQQIALWQKIPCSLLKKNPIILADWTSFAQIIYRCNPGTAEGTGSFAICVWLCPCYLERTFSSGAVSPASGPCFLPTAASHISRCGWCECHIAEMLQAARMLGREKRSSWVCCCACRLTVCKASLEGSLRMSAYQLLRTLKMDSSRKKLLLISKHFHKSPSFWQDKTSRI